MKKRILIDGTPISLITDGLSQYILNIVSNFDANESDYTIIVRRGQCPKEYSDLFEKKGIAVREVNIKPIGPLRDLQFFFFFFRVKKMFDTIFVPSNQYPILFNKPALFVIHDLIYEQYPEQLGKNALFKKIYLHLVVKAGLKKSCKTIAVSKFTKSDILKYHGSRHENKIEVVYEGWEHLKSENYDENFKKPAEEYMLYLGSGRGHKNLPRLVQAINNIKEEIPSHWKFVFAGNLAHLSSAYLNEVSAINESVNRELIKVTGWLSDNELNSYFKNASAFIFPSLSEGFGIPVLEAFYHKVPLLLSNKGSLPEVGGDAALYFDPVEVVQIEEVILTFIRDQNTLKDKLVELGSKQMSKFSWNKSSCSIANMLKNI